MSDEDKARKVAGGALGGHRIGGGRTTPPFIKAKRGAIREARILLSDKRWHPLPKLKEIANYYGVELRGVIAALGVLVTTRRDGVEGIQLLSGVTHDTD